LSINEFTCGLYLTPEIRVADGLFGNEVNATAKETLEFITQREESDGIGTSWLSVCHLDQEVEITGVLYELARRGRAEEIEAFNAVRMAELNEFGTLCLD
jgi:hypothetical protein